MQNRGIMSAGAIVESQINWHNRQIKLVSATAFAVEAQGALRGFPHLEEQAARLVSSIQRAHDHQSWLSNRARKGNPIEISGHGGRDA